MERHSSKNTTIINYLLGEGSDEQREKLEERYFSDDDLFARMLDVEDQLINDYLQGRLAADQRPQFERHYLTLPHKRRKVELARRLLQVPVQKVFKPAQHPDPQGVVTWLRNWRLVGGLVAAVILLSVGFATWQMLTGSQTSSELAGQPSPTVSGAPATPAITMPPAITGTRVTLLLSSELLRGSDSESSRTAFTTPATEQITINLLVPPGQAARYRASLEKLDDPGKTIQTSDSLSATSQPDGKNIVTWTFGVASLPADDYEIKLFRLDPNNAETLTGSYKFQVRPRN